MLKSVKEIRFGEHILILETGEIARQADAAVLAKMGGTQVLVTVVAQKEAVEGKDFFPLTVNYIEKAYAGGKIPGGFNKREALGRSEVEVLTSRLIDRPIRPLFPENFFNEIQIIATVLSYDENADITALIATSAALHLSGLPIHEPIAAARVGYKDGIYTLNPSALDLKTSELDLVVAGTEDAILMVESEARELTEDVMLGAVLFGQEMFKNVIQGIKELGAEAAKEKWKHEPDMGDEAVEDKIRLLVTQQVEEAYLIKDKLGRYQRLNEISQAAVQQITQEFPDQKPAKITDCIGKIEKQVVRQRIINGEARIDGRSLSTVRPISIRTKLLERAHGSVLFTRGETQAIVVATLGNERDAQILDGLVGESKDRFMLHYNFPGYSVGEINMLTGPKRREIGHGRLAKRSLMAVLPTASEFPYVLRVVSEITESNGSSSMASVCGASLALMDAGVPLKAPVAGVAMGLIKEGEKFAVLTDILGDEDHLGDMDFKVAGTEKGITALQMDIKITGITKEIMEQALEQALEGRLHILGIMNNALSEHRVELSEHAPRITTMKVAEDKIRTIIGKGGSTIKGLIESTGVSIDIDDNGVVQLFSPNETALSEAERQIRALIAEVEVGQTYQGKVTKIVDFGAFINLLPGKDGLLHISQICADRNQKVETVLQEGQEIEVFVAGVDKQGRVKLEWKNKPEAPVEEKSASQAKSDVDVGAEEQVTSSDE